MDQDDRLGEPRLPNAEVAIHGMEFGRFLDVLPRVGAGIDHSGFRGRLRGDAVAVPGPTGNLYRQTQRSRRSTREGDDAGAHATHVLAHGR